MAVRFRAVNGRLVGPRYEGHAVAGPIPAGAPGKAIDADALWETLTETVFVGKFADERAIRLGDATYYAPRRAELERLLEASLLDRRQWLEERHDCDDFAYVLKGEASSHAYESPEVRYGLCVGIVWGHFDWVDGYHAINWALTSDAGLLLIEPQTDAIYEPHRCTGQVGLLLV